MSTVELRKRSDNTIHTIEDQSISTILDLKRRLNSDNPTSVLLTFKGKILKDSTPIETLGENPMFILEEGVDIIDDVLNEVKKVNTAINEKVDISNKVDTSTAEMYRNTIDKVTNNNTVIDTIINSQNDIEFTEIEPQQRVAFINNKPVFLNQNDIFYKQGKPFLITKRTRKFKLKDLIAFFKKNLTRAHLFHVAFMLLVLFSRNYPLLIIILTVNMLRIQSFLLLRSRVWETFKGHALYSGFMFVASLFAIDHERFVKRIQ